jgi:8-oxo-dGTP pyrophosphatase MutT (NUDIX family)
MSVALLGLNVVIRVAQLLIHADPRAYWSVQAAGLVALAVSIIIVLSDLQRAQLARYNVRIIQNPDAIRAASAVRIGANEIRLLHGSATMCFDPRLDLALERSSTFIDAVIEPYSIPQPLLPYYNDVIRAFRPTINGSKVRLRSDLTPDSLSHVYLQRSSYFAGVITNEVATSFFTVADWDHNREDIVTRVFDDYVVSDGHLAPLAESALANNIGVVTVVVTADNCIVLQTRGMTLVDSGKITVGASGQATWNDLRDSHDTIDPHSGKSSKTLQNLLKYAMEREASEETGVTVGPAKSRTTLTGFARHVHRGGKPEFYGITYVAQRYDDMPRSVSRSERKWVRMKMRRQLQDGSIKSLVSGADDLIREYTDNEAASASMIKALHCARAYLVAGNVEEHYLRP